MVAEELLRILTHLSADILPLEEDLSCGRIIETDHGTADRRLTGTGLTDEAVGLARIDLEADVIDRLHREGIRDLEILL